MNQDESSRVTDANSGWWNMMLCCICWIRMNPDVLFLLNNGISISKGSCSSLSYTTRVWWHCSPDIDVGKPKSHHHAELQLVFVGATAWLIETFQYKTSTPAERFLWTMTWDAPYFNSSLHNTVAWQFCWWPFQRLSTSRPFNAPFVHFRATVAAHLAVSRKYFASGLPSANGWVLVPKQWCWSLATIDQNWSNKTCQFALYFFGWFGFHQKTLHVFGVSKTCRLWIWV